MARQVPEIIFKMAELSIESIIAELVDNSLDQDAKKISVQFFSTDKSNNDVGIAVFDTGNGFDDDTKLFHLTTLSLIYNKYSLH